MVEEHIQGGYPTRFKEQLKQTPPNNFQEALDILSRYIATSRMRMPPFLGSNSTITHNPVQVISSQTTTKPQKLT